MPQPTSTINYYYSPNSKALTILTHGASEGIDSDFMKAAITKVKKSGSSVLVIQMPYKDRGENSSSGPELLEELNATKQALEFVEYNNFSSLKFIGKSLGGIIFSKFLEQANTEVKSKSSLTILGFIYAETVIPSGTLGVTIIQGEFDKYGTVVKIQEEINKTENSNVKLIVIENADHSYRDGNNQPIYQDGVIELI